MALAGVVALVGIAAMAPPAQATTAHVRAFEFGFGPAVSSVSLLPDLLLRVEYRNIGGLPHQATSFADGGLLGAPQGLCINSPVVDPGRTVTVIIPNIPSCIGQDRAIGYFCAIHPFMQGVIIVRLA